MRYRVQKYMDGNGKMYYTPQRRFRWLPLWLNCNDGDPRGASTIEFSTREAAEDWIVIKMYGDTEWMRSKIREKL